MVVLLIHPEISRTKYNFVGIIENECLELEYISAMLKEKGHTVFLYDGQVEQKTVAQTIVQCKPDVVYVCGRTRQENFMLEYCAEAKRYNPAIITMVGGLHAQLCYERFYKDEVDYIFISFDIFHMLDVLGKRALGEIPGICYKDNGMWKKNDAQPFDIRRLPRPDRSYFYEHPGNYRYLELEHAAWVRTAYGCPYRCSFCHRNRMNSGKYVCRDIEDVVAEIAEIQADNIYIVDDDFLYDTKRIQKFIDLVKQRGIQKKYICYGRSDFIANNEDIMRQFREIGLYYVLVGLETTRNAKMKDYNKKSSVKNNVKSIELCNRLGINLMGMFIVDLDYRAKDFKRLYHWIRLHELKHVAISIFTPEMNLETYEQYKDRLITDNPSHWDYLHVVAKPDYVSVKKYYFHYYMLLIRLFIKGWREGIYDFIDYKDYIFSFVKNIFKKKRDNDDA